MANKQIRYGISFDVDNSNLKIVQSELQKIYSMTEKDLQLIDSKATKTELEAIQSEARKLGKALEDSFNPKLNTINITKFNNSLANSSTNIQNIGNKLMSLGPSGAQAFRALAAETLTANKELKKTSQFLDNMAKTFSNTVRWSIASSALNTFSGTIQKAWGFAKRLDTSLNDIRIVTGKSADEMDKFADKANRAAKALGASTTNYTNAALIYYQQGLGEEDVAARTEVTAKAANVTGQSSADVSEQLTAVWNGYKVVAEEAELYVDKLAAVAASTAADLEELSSGMSKVASAANTMGVDIDQLSAQLATIVSVTRQDASVVGTALKTIYARMGDLKVSGVDEFGTSLGDVSGQMHQMGIEVLDQEGNLREMGEVIEEVAEKWEGWTDAQQQAAAVAIAGKRQYNNLIALFENWDMYESALGTSQASAGTLQKQQDIYMDSLEAHLQELATSGEKIYKALFDSESMKDFLGILTQALDKIGSFIDAIGGGGNLLLGFGSIATKVFNTQITSSIVRVLGNLKILKQNALDVQAELELREKFGNVNDEAMKKMVKIKEQEYQNEKYLTEEEKKQYELLIKQTAEAQKQVELAEKEKQTAENYYKEQTGKSVSDKWDENKNAGNQYASSRLGAAIDLETKEASLNSFLENKTDKGFAKSINQLDKSADKEWELLSKNDWEDLTSKELETKSKDFSEEQLQDYKDLLDTRQKMTDANKILKKSVGDLIHSHDLEAKSLTKVEEAYKLYQKGKINQKQLEKTVIAAVEDSAKAHRKNAEALKETPKILEKAKEGAQGVEKSFKDLTKSIDTKKLISNIANVASSALQLLYAFQSLKNLGNIWSDENLSFSEKFSQTLTVIATTLPMIVSAYKGITGIIGINTKAIIANFSATQAKTEQDKRAALVQFLLAKGIDKTEDELNSLTTAQLLEKAISKGLIISNSGLTLSFKLLGDAIGKASKKLWGFITNPVVLSIIGIVLAIIAVVTILNKAFSNVSDNGKKAFSDASEAAKGAAEEFNRVKTAYDELKKSLEDYNNAQKAIDELTTGTDEWRQAIQEANMQVIDLMNKYPELAQYVDNVNGQLKISATGQEAVLKAQEERVAIANRANMAAQSNKLVAKNNMTRLEGANKTLNTDAYQNWAVVSGMFGGATGGILSGVLAAEANDREAAYIAALEMIGKDNSIMASEEVFSNAMKDAGFEKYADILWENKEALLQNSAAIEANNAVIKLQQKEIARSYLIETEAFNNLESENQDTLTTIIAKETGSNSKAYQDTMSELGGDSIDKKDGATIAEEYASLMNIDAVETKYDKDTGAITYIDSNGEVAAKVNVKAAQIALAQEQASAGITDSYIEEKIKLLEELEEKTNSVNKSFGNLITKFAAGESTDLTSGTSKQIEELQGVVDAYNTAYESAIDSDDKGSDIGIEEKMAAGGEAFAQALGYANEEELEKAAKKMGYDSIEEYKDAIQESIDNYNKEKRKLTLGLDSSVVQGLDTLKGKLVTAGKDFEDFSLQTQKIIVSGLETAFEKGGSQGLNAFNQLIAEGNFNETEIQKISDAMAGIDWTSSGSVNDLQVALKEVGIEIDFASGYWDSMVKAMEASTNVVQDVVNNFDTLRGTLASIAEITDDIHLGDIISDEDYDTLVANNAELKKYFVITADGYKYLGGADKEFEKAKNNVLDVDEIKENFEAAKESGDSLLASGNAFLETDKKTGKVSVKAGQQGALRSALVTGGYDNVLKAAGYSAEQYKKKANELKANSAWVTKSDGTAVSLATIKSAASSEDLVKILGYDSIQAYADAKFNGDYNLANETLTNAMSDASTRISDAETYMKNAETATINTLNQMQSGEWDQMSRDAQITAVSGLAKNYKELQEYKNQLYSEDYNKLATVYLAEEAEQLGINADIWEAYVNSVKENLETQDNMLENSRKLQLYNDVDKYAYLNKAIEDTTKELDELVNAQNRAFGKDILDNIDNQIEKIEELADEENGLYKQRYEEKQNEVRVMKATFATDNAYLNDLGLNNIVYNKDGTISESSFNAILAKAEETGDETLVEILNKILNYNDLKINAEEEYNEALKESQEQILDLQIEKYNQEIEMNKQYKDTIKQWRNTLRDFGRFSAEGIAAFGELSANTNIGFLISEFKSLGAGTIDPESFARITELESWKGGRGTNNRFVNDGIFDENAFNEAYSTAIEDAQGDVQELIDLGQEMFDTWFTALEEISSLYDEQVEKLSTINSLLEGSASLNQLFGKSSKAYFTQIRQNAEKTVDLYAAQVSELEKQYNNFFDANGNLINENDKERANAVWKAYTQAKQNHIDAIQAQYDAITVEFEQSMQEVVDSIFNGALGGSINNFSELWNLQKSTDEMYFDDVNAEYERYKLERQFMKSIDTTDNIAAQNKLKKVLDEQLAILKEKDKLSQYDIDRANAMYDLTLKQIALEEAQQAMNKMKLTRDAMGNYTYQYVADEDKIAQAEEDLAAAENELYNLQKEHQKSLIDTLISGIQEYQELTVKYINDPAMLKNIQDHYSTVFGDLMGDIEELGVDITEITSLFNTDISTPWLDTFETLANTDVEGLLESTANLFSGEDGVTAALSTVQTNFDNYLEKENDVINRLETYTQSAIDLADDAVKLETSIETLSQYLNNTVVPNLTTLITNLEDYAQNYVNYLANSIGTATENITDNANNSNQAIEDETNATRENTRSTNELTDTLKAGVPIAAMGMVMDARQNLPPSEVLFDQSRNGGAAYKGISSGPVSGVKLPTTPRLPRLER